MKTVREYVTDFHPPLERLEALLERVQRDAFEAGARAGGVHMFEIVRERVERSERRLNRALSK